MTPEQLREGKWCEHDRTRKDCEFCELEQLRLAHAAALEEVERAKRENDTLRGLLGNSAKPCPYCGLAAEDQAKCASGFPGCARADDQQLSKHFADAYRAERAGAALADAERKIERLKWYSDIAESMLSSVHIYDSDRDEWLANYQAEFK